jgi:hypothetical protein
MGDINASGIAQSGVDQLNIKQLTDAVSSAQKDYEDVAKDVAAFNKVKEARGSDPAREMALAQRYTRARARLQAAQVALNDNPDATQLGVPQAKAGKDAAQAADEQRKARLQALMQSAAEQQFVPQ